MQRSVSSGLTLQRAQLPRIWRSRESFPNDVRLGSWRTRAQRFHVEHLRKSDIMPNLGAATSLRIPKPLQVELQHSWCAVESECFGGTCFRFAFETFKFVVAINNIGVREQAKCLGNGDGPVHLK